MKEYWDNPALIIGVILGFLLAGFGQVFWNLVSDYLKPPLDIFFSRISVRWQKRTTKKKEEFEALVQNLRNDPIAQLLVVSDKLGYRITALVGGVVVFLCYSRSETIQILRRINEEALKNSVPSLDFIGPVVVSSAPSTFLENMYLFMATFFYFSLIQYGITGSMRLGAAITEARNAQTPDKEQADTEILPAGDE